MSNAKTTQLINEAVKAASIQLARAQADMMGKFAAEVSQHILRLQQQINELQHRIAPAVAVDDTPGSGDHPSP